MAHDPSADVAGVLDAAGVGVWRWDPQRGEVVWDAATLRIFGQDEAGFGGTFEAFVAGVHPDDRAETVSTIMAAAGTGGPFLVRHRVVRPGGDIRWVEGRGFVEMDGAGNLKSGAGVVYEVEADAGDGAQRRSMAAILQRARDESASNRRRLRSLIEADAALAGTLNRDRLAARLAEYLVRHGAGLAVIDLAAESPEPEALTLTRRDRDGSEVVSVAAAREAPAAWQRVHGLPRSTLQLATSEAVAAGWWLGDDPRQQDGIASVPGDLVSVPLVARGRLVGRMSVVRAAGSGWSQPAVEVLEAVAQRAGTAFDQAEVYADRSRVASAFRASIVPAELPEAPGLEVAVEYRPLHELTQIGGDFYDVFATSAGTALSVGDVCGKGIGAAVLAAPARHTLRAATLAGSRPAEALRILNGALLLERSQRFVTAALVEVAVGRGSASVRAAAGGHPAPVVLRAGGAVEQLEARGQLLGVFDDVELHEATAELAPGDAVVLFTDGLTEARAGHELFGGSRLTAALSDAAGLPAKAITQAVGTALDSWAGPGHLTDDVVVLVGRLTP